MVIKVYISRNPGNMEVSVRVSLALARSNYRRYMGSRRRQGMGYMGIVIEA